MSRRVLAIDDEPHILQAIKRLLRKDGYEVLTAQGGKAALDVLSTTEVAVIICDQRMPEMNGDQVLTEASRLQPGAFKITLTGYADINAAQSLINDAGVNHFVMKPWDDEALRCIVADGVRSYEMLRENARLTELTLRQKEELESWNARLEAQVTERTAQLAERNAELTEVKQRIESSLRDTVVVIAGLLEAYSPNLGIHAKRVAMLSREIAAHLDLSPEEMRDIEFAAYLHDIGKIATASGAGGSGDAGHRHSDSGRAILSRVGGFEQITEGIYRQFEQHNGLGYPGKLSGDQIPLASRIIAVVNAYDEAVFGAANVLDISRGDGERVLKDGSGKRFDPCIVRLVLDYAERVLVAESADTEVQLSPKQLEPGMVLSRDISNHEGILLLKGNTILTPAFIERIRRMSYIDPILTNIFVKSRPKLPGADYEVVGVASGRDASEEKTATEAIAAASAPPESPPSTSNAIVSAEPASPVEAAKPDAETPDVTRRDPAGSRPKVLVVDDSELIRRAMTRELRRIGFDVIDAASGPQALELIKSNTFAAALVDLAMPEMSGEELIAKLDDVAPELPCIVVTGNATMKQVRVLTGARNVSGILVKPWDHKRLVDALSAAIRKGRAVFVKEHA